MLKAAYTDNQHHEYKVKEIIFFKQDFEEIM